MPAAQSLAGCGKGMVIKMEQQERDSSCLRLHAESLQEELNLRLICSMEAEEWQLGQIIWVEKVTLTDIRYPETKAPGTPAPDGGSGIGSRIAKARKYIFSKIMEKWMTIKNK